MGLLRLLELWRQRKEKRETFRRVGTKGCIINFLLKVIRTISQARNNPL
jgi:hypothetical protein